MQRSSQILGLVFIAISAYIVWESFQGLQYYTELGPGSGFFPLWLGFFMGGLSLAWLVQVSGRKGSQKEVAFLPERAGIVRILLIVASLVLVAICMKLLGFQLSMFLVLVFWTKVLGRQPLWGALVTAFIGSVGMYRVFGKFLALPLPTASVEFLAHLGL
jgi:putative tricarboxylic transport membrane protein